MPWLPVHKASAKSRKIEYEFSLFSIAFIILVCKLSNALYDLLIYHFGNHIDVYTTYHIYPEMKLVFVRQLLLFS